MSLAGVQWDENIKLMIKKFLDSKHLLPSKRKISKATLQLIQYRIYKSFQPTGQFFLLPILRIRLVFPIRKEKTKYTLPVLKNVFHSSNFRERIYHLYNFMIETLIFLEYEHLMVNQQFPTVKLQRRALEQKDFLEHHSSSLIKA